MILTQEDLLTWRQFPDGCVTTTFGIDLHYPVPGYAKKYPDNPFISRADVRPLKNRTGYALPYRCFYSRNVPNLFMAGRCISVSHEALGTVRVMRNCGMMGEVVGKAAYVAVRTESSPRAVYQQYWNELGALLREPHNMRRTAIGAPLEPDETISPRRGLPEVAHPAIRRKATNHKEEYVPVKSLAGIIVDDTAAVINGYWWTSENLPGYIGDCYLRAWGGTPARIRYEFRVPKSGRYEIRLSYIPYGNRATNVPATIEGTAEGPRQLTLNQHEAPELPNGFHALGVWTFHANQPAAVVLSAATANGLVHADCVQVVPKDEK